MIHHVKYIHPTSQKWVVFVHGAGGSSTIWFKQLRDYKRHFNVLLLDLRGHGNSKPKIKDTLNTKYTFDFITDDIVEVLDEAHIKSAHFVGISLGCILIRNLSEKYPDRVESMILGGSIMKMNIRSRFLMIAGNIFKSVIPYMLLYKLFAFVIMPRKNHKKSRTLFVREAQKLYQNEFIKWFKLSSEVNPLLKFFRERDNKIPALYVMGEEDYLFLPAVRDTVKKHSRAALHIIQNCGHVVNVEQPVEFNSVTIDFINGVSRD